MSDTVAAYGRPGATWPGGGVAAARWEPPDARRRLQLALAAIWLLDAVLQYQSFMFTRAFARMLAASADGNPAIVAAPITWSARIIGQHAVAANSVFATVQLLLALGIALPRSLPGVSWAARRPVRCGLSCGAVLPGSRSSRRSGRREG